MDSISTKDKLSTLWIVIMFNMLTADILGFSTSLVDIPGAVEEMLSFLGETPLAQAMLGAAIMMEIAIAMIFFSRILKYKANRWANIIAAIITIVFVAGGGSLEPHYIFLAAVEVLCALIIIWSAWKWSEQEA